MKNLHIISSNKPSKLVRVYNDVNRENFALKLGVEVNDSFKEYVNVYIISDEEIKSGDWCLFNNRLVVRYFKSPVETKSFKKIILTTDQDLINDGVQEIDDEFLEWFVKNPNCDFVMTIPDVRGLRDIFQPTGKDLYKIIIPKEEYIFPDIKCKCIMFEPNSFTGMCKNCGFPPKEKPKTMLESLQEYFKNTPKEKVLEDWNEFQQLDEEGITVKEFLENQKQTDEKGRPLTYWGGLEENIQETFVNEKCFKCGRNRYSSRKPFCTDDFCNKDFYQKTKQETFEDAAKDFVENTMKFSFTSIDTRTQANRMLKCVEFGAKWQQKQDENLYSEEDLREAFRQGELNINYSEMYGLDSELTEQQWFEQFKKK